MARTKNAAQRVALLGGSFNPPHVGHQMLCLWVLSSGQADAVWFVPTFRHAFSKPLISFQHRVAMCEHSREPLPGERMVVSQVEKEIGGESRTVKTLRALRDKHRRVVFRLLIGADLLSELDAWQDVEEVKRLAPLIVVGRAGYAGAPPDAPEFPAISSTRIRQRLAAGKDVSQLVPVGVLDYIRKHRLYMTRAAQPTEEA